MTEEFISTVSIQHQKDSSFMVSVPHRIVKRLNIKSQQEAKVLLDDNKIIYIINRGGN
jgi:antitoxin component of MazEF toxin-antitoxin module